MFIYIQTDPLKECILTYASVRKHLHTKGNKTGKLKTAAGDIIKTRNMELLYFSRDILILIK